MGYFLWSLAIGLLFYAFFLFSFREQEKQQIDLQNQIDFLNQKKQLQQQLHAQLQAQIASKDTFEWKEKILMKELGLVPKGYTKISFEENSKEH